MNKILITSTLLLLAGSSALAATLDEAVETCGKKKGSAKTCCTMLLDEPDEIAACVRTISGKSAPLPMSPPLPSSSTKSPAKPQATEAPAGDTAKSTRNNSSRKETRYAIGEGFQPHDMSHLPAGRWERWQVTIHDNSYNQKEYGLKAPDIKRFEKKLADIAALTKETPALNAIKGCNPSLSGYIDGVYDPTDPFAKSQPVRGTIMFGCFKLFEETKKKKGVTSTAWVPNHETRHYIMYVNGLQEFFSGKETWHEGTSSIRPFETLFTMPTQVGEHQGFPIYSGSFRRTGKLQDLYLLIVRDGVQPFLPVSRERFLKALINKVDDEIRTRFRGRAIKDLPYSTQTQRETYRRDLAALTPEEREQPACTMEKKADIGLGHQYMAGAFAAGTAKCEPVVRLNPALINPKAPRTSVQFVAVSRFDDIQAGYINAKPGQKDDLSHFRVTMDTIIQTDWKKVYNMIDKP